MIFHLLRRNKSKQRLQRLSHLHLKKEEQDSLLIGKDGELMMKKKLLIKLNKMYKLLQKVKTF